MKAFMVLLLGIIMYVSCTRNINSVKMPGVDETTTTNTPLITRSCMFQPTNSTGGTESSTDNIFWHGCLGYTCNAGYNNVSGACVASIPTCPTDYVKILANATLGTPAFCIAKYEMKAVDNSGNLYFDGYNGGVALDVSLYKPASMANGVPWVKITYAHMQSECASLGSGYHLATLAEWQAMALDIESVMSNSAIINTSRYFLQGNSDGVIIASAETDGLTTAGTKMLIAEDGSPYAGTGNSNRQPWDAGANQKRTFDLSSGDEIWDVSGNAREIVDVDGAGGTISYTNPGASGYYEISAATVASTIQSMTTSNNYPIDLSFVQPADSTMLDADTKIGRFYISSGSRTQRIISRGGNFAGNNYAGIFSGDLDQAFDGLSGSGGFRCALPL